MVVQVQVVKLVKLSVSEPFIVIKTIVSESGNHAAKIGNVKMMTNTNTGTRISKVSTKKFFYSY